jgi:uncharacterized protein with WD repeat
MDNFGAQISGRPGAKHGSEENQDSAGAKNQPQKKNPPAAVKVNRGRKQIQKAGREIRAIGEVKEKADRDDDAHNPEALFKFKF